MSVDSPSARISRSEWRTPAEVADYRTTPDFAETVRFVERIASACPETLHVEEFGRTGEGRTLEVVVASHSGLFGPELARAAGRVVLLVQNCIHAGEPDGKDACLALLRDIAAPEGRQVLPESVVLLVIPVYNVDGHERRSSFHRINQNGPDPAGWRANGTNLNLNRDYMKADAPETRAFLRLFRRWSPDFFVDDHVTDGADFQYDVTFQLDATPDVSPATADWVRERVTPALVASVNASGHLAFPSTIFLRDDTDPAKGLAFNENPPRFSTGQMILENRPGLLVEMHMLKEYRTRVRGNYELLRALLEVLGRDADRLRALNRSADAEASELGTEVGRSRSFPLVVAGTGETTPVRFRGRAFERYRSDVSGAAAVRYQARPWETDLPVETAAKVEVSVRLPAGYIVPPQWAAVIDVLDAHGVSLRRTTTEWTGVVERYQLSGLEWPPRPFEGRFPILRGGNVERAFGRFGTCQLVTEKVSFPTASVVVPLEQRLAKVAIHWLEPEAPDSAVRWGFLNPVFEQKESGEGYVLEDLAARELASDPAVRREFEARVASDRPRADDRASPLAFFYQRSPWGRANAVGVYPVGRLPSLVDLPLDRSA
jgi:murein tripeptide amidase MpaA